MSGLPICVAPSRNVTEDTVPSLSAAFADTVMVLPATTDALFIGAVMLTVGGTFATAEQTPETQFPLWQSALIAHVLPFAHFVVHEPPQSTSVSLPFLKVSVHVAVAVTPMAVDVVLAPPLSVARAVSEWLPGVAGTVQLTL